MRLLKIKNNYIVRHTQIRLKDIDDHINFLLYENNKPNPITDINDISIFIIIGANDGYIDVESCQTCARSNGGVTSTNPYTNPIIICVNINKIPNINVFLFVL